MRYLNREVLYWMFECVFLHFSCRLPPFFLPVALSLMFSLFLGCGSTLVGKFVNVVVRILLRA